MTSMYQFPPNYRAMRNTLMSQWAYAMGEMFELRDAIEGESDERIAAEGFDVKQCIEGIHRQLGLNATYKGYEAVLKRCSERGDYR